MQGFGTTPLAFVVSGNCFRFSFFLFFPFHFAAGARR